MVTPTTLTLGAGLGAVTLAIGWSAVSDVRAYTIPNWTSLLIVGSFILVALLTPHAPLLPGLLTGGAVLVVGLVMFALGWMGGGDVKLFSALALWCGPSRLADFTIVTTVAGAVLALIMLSPLRRLAPAATEEARSAVRQPMPYGVAIAAGGVWIISQYLPYLG